MPQNSLNYSEQGGASWKVGGTLAAEGSGTIVATSATTLTSLDATVTELNRVADASTRIVNLTAATLAVTEAAHDNKIVTVNKADGSTLTLPAATGSGTKLHFIVGTTITSVGLIIQVTGNDTMTGFAFVCNDTDASVSGFETSADTDTITLNGTTTGGIKGDSVELVDIAADLWWVRVNSSATGSEATPFSAAV
jgi:hypothetical protein